MTVVKFSVLSIIAGGFCALLGIGIWMGPQETACSAGPVERSVAASPCANATTECDVDCEAGVCPASCDGASCDVASCEVDDVEPAVTETACDSPACDASPVNVASVAASCSTCCADSCPSGTCTTSPPLSPYAMWIASDGTETIVPDAVPAAPCPSPRGSCGPGGCASYASAPVDSPGCTPYPSPAPAYAQAPQRPADASYSEAVASVAAYGPAPPYALPVPGTPPSETFVSRAVAEELSFRELIEALFEEREARYEATLEAHEAARELQMEAMGSVAEIQNSAIQMQSQTAAQLMEAKAEAAAMQAQAQTSVQLIQMQAQAEIAAIKAQHETAMVKLQAEAMLKLRQMEQANREDKALLQLVAEGVITPETLAKILDKWKAAQNAKNASQEVAIAKPAGKAENCPSGCGALGDVQALVRREDGCGFDYERSRSCSTCGFSVSVERRENVVKPTGDACVCSDCEACVCVGSDACKTVTVTAVASKAGACKCDACKCETCKCGKCECEKCACEACECGKCKCDGCKSEACACDKCACESCECPKTAGAECDCKGCKSEVTVAVECETCPGGNCPVAACSKSACSECECPSGVCPTKVVETDENAPFICELDGCELHVDVPMLSKIPYVSRLFKNAGNAHEAVETAPVAP